jgi:dCMP deaminase
LQGSTVFVTHLCCAQCAALLIQAGVSKVVCGDGTTSMPQEQFKVAKQMFKEAGVELCCAPESEAFGSADVVGSV